MEKGAVFPLFYLPNVEFFKNLQNQKENIILLEKHENYPKQTSRNRTVIAGPNGNLSLTVPVKKGNQIHTLYKDIRISNEDNWQRIHWLSLETSYRSSSYFEFYEDAFYPFYHKKYDFLFDLNEELLAVILNAIKLPISYGFTESYQKQPKDLIDFRESLNWKNVTGYKNKPYFQVFEDKYGYQNNLSIVDLLFNQGPQAAKFF
ncbi:MAG TPA: WbqC family protein [Pelobium sp.]